MKISTLTILTSVLFASSFPFIFAEPIIAQESSIIERNNNQVSIIPQDTAIVIQVLENYQLDAGVKKEIPVTFLLVSPIINNQGNILIPANSVVEGKIITGNGQAKITVDSLIIFGKVVAINAENITLTGSNIVTKTRQQKAKEVSDTLTRLGTSIMGVFGGNSDELIQGGFGGNAIGIVSGLASSEQVSVVQINQGATYVFPLSESVILR